MGHPGAGDVAECEGLQLITLKTDVCNVRRVRCSSAALSEPWPAPGRSPHVRPRGPLSVVRTSPESSVDPLGGAFFSKAGSHASPALQAVECMFSYELRLFRVSGRMAR